MAIQPGDQLEVSFAVENDGVEGVNIFHLDVVSIGSNLTDDALVTDLIDDFIVPTWVFDEWQAANSEEVQAKCFKVQKILPVREGAWYRTLPSIPGGVPSGAMPTQCCVLGRLFTDSDARGRTGRKYFMAPAKSHCQNGRLVVAGWSAWNSALLFWTDQVGLTPNGANYTPGLIDKLGAFHQFHRQYPDPVLHTHRSRTARVCAV